MNGRVILKTARCVVRELESEDLDDLYRLYEPESITRFVEPLFEREQEEIYQENYRKIIYGIQGFGQWGVFDKETHKLIGRMGVEALDRLPEDTVELGYVVDVSRQREGIAFEVCTAIIEYAFSTLGFKRIVAHINPKNTASVALIKKLGFSPSDSFLNGEREWQFKSDCQT